MDGTIENSLGDAEFDRCTDRCSPRDRPGPEAWTAAAVTSRELRTADYRRGGCRPPPVPSTFNQLSSAVNIDAATGAVQQSWAVGNAPRDMVKVDTKLYVSNEGGRPAKSGDTTINSYNTQVPASPVAAATTTGTVSVIDLTNPAAAVASIDVGLHPTALYAEHGALFVTNTATNDVSVIDTARNKVVQTVATQPWPEALVGYEPDAVTLTDDGHLLVTLGRANPVAAYRYTTPQEPVSYVGLLPKQRLTGPDTKPDFANPAQMNHFTWYETHQWKKPYPARTRSSRRRTCRAPTSRRRSPTADVARSPQGAPGRRCHSRPGAPAVPEPSPRGRLQRRSAWVHKIRHSCCTSLPHDAKEPLPGFPGRGSELRWTCGDLNPRPPRCERGALPDCATGPCNE